MKKIVFSSDDLPPGPDDRARFKLWHDTYCDWVGPTDLDRLSDGPFVAQWEFVSLKETLLGRFRGSTHTIARSSQQIAASPQDRYFLSFNSATAALSFAQRRKEEVVSAGQALLFSGTDAFRCEGVSDWVSVGLPKLAVKQVVPNVDDLIATPFDTHSPTITLLRKYIARLLEVEGIEREPALLGHVVTTLIDLFALALGAKGDAAEIASLRGLRAARASSILAEIRTGFADPAFSPRNVAAKLGLTTNYLQKLLHETGVSFTERTLELRLQKARAMLADPGHQGKRIGEISYLCGFNEVSYFNRCFRRRFGASPTQHRGGGDADPEIAGAGASYEGL